MTAIRATNQPSTDSKLTGDFYRDNSFRVVRNELLGGRFHPEGTVPQVPCQHRSPGGRFLTDFLRAGAESWGLLLQLDAIAISGDALVIAERARVPAGGAS